MNCCFILHFVTLKTLSSKKIKYPYRQYRKLAIIATTELNRSLAIRKQLFSKEHSDAAEMLIAESLDNLAEVYFSQSILHVLCKFPIGSNQIGKKSHQNSLKTDAE